MMETVRIFFDRTVAGAADLARWYAEVFAALAERPRRLRLRLEVSGGEAADLALDCCGGAVLLAGAGRPVELPLARRYIAEHPAPWVLPAAGRADFVLSPATGGRVRVRTARWWERLLP